MNGLSMTYLEKFEGFKRQEIGCCAIRWIEEDDVLMFLTSDSCEEALWGGILGPFTRLLGTRSCFAFFGFAYYLLDGRGKFLVGEFWSAVYRISFIVYGFKVE